MRARVGGPRPQLVQINPIPAASLCGLVVWKRTTARRGMDCSRRQQAAGTLRICVFRPGRDLLAARYYAASKSQAFRPCAFIAATGDLGFADRSLAQIRKPMRFEIVRQPASDRQTTNHHNRRRHSHRSRHIHRGSSPHRRSNSTAAEVAEAAERRLDDSSSRSRPLRPSRRCPNHHRNSRRHHNRRDPSHPQ